MSKYVPSDRSLRGIRPATRIAYDFLIPREMLFRSCQSTNQTRTVCEAVPNLPSSLNSNASAGTTTGGMRRFVILAIVVLGVLVGSAVGLLYWIHVTGKAQYDGPAKLVYPEHRYYR